jgi:hypothetical protein
VTNYNNISIISFSDKQHVYIRYFLVQFLHTYTHFSTRGQSQIGKKYKYNNDSNIMIIIMAGGGECG